MAPEDDLGSGPGVYHGKAIVLYGVICIEERTGWCEIDDEAFEHYTPDREKAFGVLEWGKKNYPELRYEVVQLKLPECVFRAVTNEGAKP